MTRPAVVVLGGTFDPVHVGHLALLRGAVDALGATSGVFVVEPGHRHRAAPVAPLAARRELVRIATQGDRRLFEAAELGLVDRLDAAVHDLHRAGRDVHVVFGADSARHLDRWDGAHRLAAARLWVVAREGDDGAGIDHATLLHLELPTVSASGIRSLAAAGVGLIGMLAEPCRLRVEALYGARDRARVLV